MVIWETYAIYIGEVWWFTSGFEVVGLSERSVFGDFWTIQEYIYIHVVYVCYNIILSYYSWFYSPKSLAESSIDRHWSRWLDPIKLQAFAQSLASSHLQKAVLFPQGLRKCLGLGDVRSWDEGYSRCLKLGKSIESCCFLIENLEDFHEDFRAGHFWFP